MFRCIWAIVLLLISLQTAEAQTFSFGIKGGLRFTPAFEGRSRSRAEARDYTVGPAVEVRLPVRLAVEVNALYKRTGESGGGCMFTTCAFSRSRANIWEFPTLVKYRFAAIPGTFVTAGPSFRHVGKGETTSESYRTGPLVAGEQVDYTILRSTYYQPSEASLGFTGGAGLEYRTLGLNVSFDARYTRWASAYWEAVGSHGYFKRSNPNQAEFLLGLTF